MVTSPRSISASVSPRPSWALALLVLLPATAHADPQPVAQESLAQDAAEPDPLPDKIAQAGKDVAELWKVVKWCQEAGRRSDAREICATIIELDPEDLEARKWLGHQKYDDRWFESYSALSKFKREEDKRMLEEHGLVRFGDGWAKPDEVPFMRMGWEKDDRGEWASAAELARRAQEAEYAAGDWVQQADLVWVPADEAGNIESGLWKCGEEWLDIAKANEFHSNLSRPWTVPGTQFIVSTTLPWDWAAWARYHADTTAADLGRAYGKKPRTRPMVEVVASLAQYNTLSGANPAPEQDGLSSIHYAFFAESWFDGSSGTPQYKGRGVCYWDVGDSNLAGFGPYAVRHAAAQSYAEAIDPSWDTVSRWSTGAQSATPAFWAEKSIPRWFRYGVASYVERYYIDANPGEGLGPEWVREWALENLRRLGGLRPVPEVFQFTLAAGSPEASANSAKLIHEAGVLLMFILDGNHAETMEAHRAFKGALVAGESTEEAVKALEAVLAESDEAIRRFAQL